VAPVTWRRKRIETLDSVEQMARRLVRIRLPHLRETTAPKEQ